MRNNKKKCNLIYSINRIISEIENSLDEINGRVKVTEEVFNKLEGI